MYSILLKVSENKWKYLLTPEGKEWSGNATEVKDQYIALIKNNPLDNIKVVHNTEIDFDQLDIVDVEDEIIIPETPIEG